MIRWLASRISGDANAPANERSEIDEAETHAFRQRVGCPYTLRKSNRLISAFETAFAAGLSGKASNGLPLGGRRERPGNRGTRDRLSPSRTEQKTLPLLLRGHHQNQQFHRGNPRIEKPYIFGNKARGNRVSYLA
jgi:hypothetical protein